MVMDVVVSRGCWTKPKSKTSMLTNVESFEESSTQWPWPRLSYASEAEAPIYIKIRMRQWVGDVEGVSDKRIPPSCSKPQWDENVHLENPAQYKLYAAASPTTIRFLIGEVKLLVSEIIRSAIYLCM